MFSNQKFLIVLDLDGTLLSSEKKILPKTKDYLRFLSSQGHVVTMASGRPPRAILPYYRQLDLDAPLIGYNGSIILNPHEGKTIFEKRFPKRAVLDFLDSFPLSMFDNLEAEYGEKMFFLKDEKAYVDYFHKEEMDVTYGPFRDLIEEDCNSFLVSLKDEKDACKIHEKCREYDDIGMRFWYDSPKIGEFYHYTTNKSTAIQYLEKVYDIDRAHVIAFGDADNDVEMLGSAGIAFAMKNGSDQLKKIADFVTAYDNDNEGIYHSLRSIFD